MLQEYIRIFISNYLLWVIIFWVAIMFLRKIWYIYRFIKKTAEVNKIYVCYTEMMKKYKEEDGVFVGIDDRIQVKYIEIGSGNIYINFTTVKEAKHKLLALMYETLSYAIAHIEEKMLIKTNLSQEIALLNENIKELEVGIYKYI